MRRYSSQRLSSYYSSRKIDTDIARAGVTKYPKISMPETTNPPQDMVDGYESFENTNNKKKRKIPTSGGLANHHSSLSAEMAHMGISSSRDVFLSQTETDGGIGQYYGTGSSAVPAGVSGTGISGAGRGRYSRAAAKTASGRSPLGVSVNGTNALQAGRQLLQKRDYVPTGKQGNRSTFV